ncbi:hypothetical protein EK21DRAFT_117029 [Setomelanomma holmii]|uniref:Uncharacterized protein n=1 Tax=Setomelanomma holmii TaxID=210430 RepID=A0A9P4H0A4_9PLEO|nr:hypothetical protein EK21DRAFT_117029 [Setomelanomma holmii]
MSGTRLQSISITLPSNQIMAQALPLSRRSPSEADAIEVLNAVTSPLLRLSGEIRNQIYGYVFSGYSVSTDYGRQSRPPSFYLITEAEHHWQSLESVCGSMFVCRKLYAETRLLAFRLNEFYLGLDCFERLQQILNIQQLNAISRINIHLNALERHYPKEELRLLPGLKHVVVQRNLFLKEITAKDKERMIAKLKQGVRKTDIVVDFDPAMEW